VENASIQSKGDKTPSAAVREQTHVGGGQFREKTVKIDAKKTVKIFPQQEDKKSEVPRKKAGGKKNNHIRTRIGQSKKKRGKKAYQGGQELGGSGHRTICSNSQEADRTSTGGTLIGRPLGYLDFVVKMAKRGGGSPSPDYGVDVE